MQKYTIHIWLSLIGWLTLFANKSNQIKLFAAKKGLVAQQSFITPCCERLTKIRKNKTENRLWKLYYRMYFWNQPYCTLPGKRLIFFCATHFPTYKLNWIHFMTLSVFNLISNSVTKLHTLWESLQSRTRFFFLSHSLLEYFIYYWEWNEECCIHWKTRAKKKNQPVWITWLSNTAWNGSTYHLKLLKLNKKRRVQECIAVKLDGKSPKTIASSLHVCESATKYNAISANNTLFFILKLAERSRFMCAPGNGWRKQKSTQKWNELTYQTTMGA